MNHNLSYDVAISLDPTNSKEERMLVEIACRVCRRLGDPRMKITIPVVCVSPLDPEQCYNLLNILYSKPAVKIMMHNHEQLTVRQGMIHRLNADMIRGRIENELIPDVNQMRKAMRGKVSSAYQANELVNMPLTAHGRFLRETSTASFWDLNFDIDEMQRSAISNFRRKYMHQPVITSPECKAHVDRASTDPDKVELNKNLYTVSLLQLNQNG